ncbi:hypothetical protein ACN2EN_09355 [Aliarcobacter lanthieri]|uniref:hypothetical protein n=1 Tax=Aliarcobacter lanthieri TaxID=1355374 RepID=UPI00047964EE|nr:hypothetical protein [Aliarcobacter lanthieri]QKF59851.1 hypothetical protein ALANTH_1757 [Aliarcobacter lanthieri]
MSKFKKIYYIWIFLVLVIISFHPLMYYLYVGKVFPRDSTIIGDIARMTYSVDLITGRKTENNLEKKHIKYNEYVGGKVDVITIGDSFSDGAAGGLNPYYQDYIVSIYDKSVLDIKILRNSKNYIENIYALLNSGELDKMGVKYVLIESVQRRALERFSVENINSSLEDIKEFSTLILNNKKTYSENKINEKLINNEYRYDSTSWKYILNNLFTKSYNDDVSVINNLNINALQYNLRFKIKGYGLMSSHVYREKLNKDLFSTKISNELLFYDEDLKYLKLETKENIELLNKNFNLLAYELSKKGIKLIFMPAVDKYNLYRPYIISNIYKESIFFEYLETLQKDYIFINTKYILTKELENNEKDIYFVDDTHWSYKASKKIIESDIFRNIFNEK